MPKIQSAKKQLRKSGRNRARNIARKNSMKSVLKKYSALIRDGKKDEAAKELSNVYKTLDKFAKVNFIKKNKASRLKSRLSKKLAIGK